MALCPQFGPLSASSAGWGQIWGRFLLPFGHPQGGLFPWLLKTLTPMVDSKLSPEPCSRENEARDNMLAGFLTGEAGQVTTTTTNRLLESEES